MEIIVIEDGSKDNSGRICDGYAQKDNRIKVIHQINMGVSAARNRGLQIASFPFITFVDSDDIIMPDMYEKMLKVLIKLNTDCVCCNVEIINYDGSHKKLKCPSEYEIKYTKDRIEEDILKPLLGFTNKATDGLTSIWNKIYISKIVKEQNLEFNINRTHGEDWQFNIEFFSIATSVCFVEESFYQYVHHSSESLVNKYRDNYFELRLEARENFEKLLPQFDWHSDIKKDEFLQIPIDSTEYYRRYLLNFHNN